MADAAPDASARAAAPAPPAAARAHRVRIRMFRQGIGDAFLLSFNLPPKPCHILIDCGVLTGTPDAKGWAQRIAQNVEQETGGHLNAIVGTHPHWDHLSGFHDAQDVFKRLQVDEVWLSWAENPRDAGASEQKRARGLQLDAVRRAVAQLAAAPDDAVRARAAAIEETLAFHGPATLGAAGSSGTEAALEALRQLTPSPHYWEPGDLITPDWLPGVRVYVLAPPRDETLLSKLLGKKGSEMYGLGSDGGLYAALLGQAAGANPLDPEAQAAVESMRPFDASWCWSLASARAEHALSSIVQRYEAAPNAWRAIDHDWLLSAEQLALSLDNVVNNLSLVLAFEFTQTKDVLLFAADAQIGNWLSWQKLSWTIKEDGGERTIRSKDLLQRTVFYKVGHHGSHNATLMDDGLEAMIHPDLVAAIPVNQEFANKTKKWDMPAQPLYPHLIEKTRGRLLRADGAGPTATDSNQPSIDPALWAAFVSRVVADPGTPSLHVDYFLP